MSITRRDLLGLTPFALLPAALRPAILSAGAVHAPQPAIPQPGSVSPPPGIDPAFPLHPYAVVRETVGASHNNLIRVKELVGRQPALARAAVDWGFGDWEDALGAASHVGNRDIAEFLLANGARPSIFSAAMLGQLDVVKAFIAASPGIEATHGPHSITLLRHAQAGGDAAKPVFDYLSTLPAADRKPEMQPLSADEMAALTGTYVFGSGPTDRLNVKVTRDLLTVAREGGSARNLWHLGDRAFYPAGAVAVRLRFAERAGQLTLSVFDPDLIVTGVKVGML